MHVKQHTDETFKTYCRDLVRVLLLVAVLAGLLFIITELAQASEVGSSTASLGDIKLSFKLDPRLMGGTYGGERWISPPTYTGTNAQETVEVRAQVIDAKGKPTNISPEWMPSDPEMVTVSPSQGDQVKITVKRAGESKLKVAAQGISKELVIKAKYQNNAMQVEISQAAASKPEAAAAAPNTPVFKSQEEKLSYAIGMNLANALQKQSLEVNVDLLVQGFKDALSGGTTLMTVQEVRAILLEQQNDLKSKQAASQAGQKSDLAAKNKEGGEVFLEENKKKDGVVTLPSGLQYKVIKAGEGKKPTADDTVVFHFRGTLLDGTEFSNTYKRKGFRPVSFPVKGVTKGIAEALQLMPVGSKWQIFIPSDLAYGERGVSRWKIGPNATLIFEVDLISIKSTSESAAQPEDADAEAWRDGDLAG